MPIHGVALNMVRITSKGQNGTAEAFQLKGSLFTLTVLQLLNADKQAFAEQLAALVRTTPKFFEHTPIVIDLTKVTEANLAIDFSLITTQLRLHGLIPVGIRGEILLNKLQQLR